MQHIAREGRCFVVGVNQCTKVSDFPVDYPPHVEKREAGKLDEITCRGGSCIVDPLGNVIAGPLWDEEGILFAELDMGLVVESKVGGLHVLLVVEFYAD